MSFSRTESGLAAEYLFYSEVLVYVEGYTDIPFYDAVLQNYNCRLKSKNGKLECEKLATLLQQNGYPYVVVLDGHYEILERKRSQHRRIVLLHRHSYENYLLEEEPIKQFCGDRVRSEDSLEEPLTSEEFTEFVGDTEVKLKNLLVLDIAHQRSKTGSRTFVRDPDRFFKSDFRDNEIQKQCTEASTNIDIKSVNETKTLVEAFLQKRRCLDLIPGHFAFGIIRRLISNIIGKSVPSAEIRVYLSRMVWRLVKTRDHDSLKRRLCSAVREAEQMRQANSS